MRKYLRENPPKRMDFVTFFIQRHDTFCGKFDWTQLETFGERRPVFSVEEKDDLLASVVEQNIIHGSPLWNGITESTLHNSLNRQATRR
jgi:hypothetical protein